MYTQSVEIKPFSQRYIDYYYRCLSNTYNCLEGAYRAGKTVINIYSFANYLEYCKDKIHLVSGASSTTARLNVADCNGLGLTAIFRGRCKSGKYEGNECLKINTKTGIKIVIFVGGGQSDSYKRIQGLSFGSWSSVELANLYISDDEKDFVSMALSRLTQSHDKKVWWDLNPVYPTHKVYTKYIDKFCENKKIKMNFMKCSLFDNTALSEYQKQELLNTYPDKNSVEYQRGILGNRACSDGLIFTLFAKDSSPWILNDLNESLKGVNVQFISIGVDFGGNGSNTAFCATLICNNYHLIIPFFDDEIDMKGGNSDVIEFHERFKSFLLTVISLNLGVVRYIYGDSADPVMINEIRSVIKELSMYNQIRVLDCQKHTIKKRITAKQSMLARRHWLVNKSCKYVIGSTEHQVWDSRQGHEDERLDNGSVDIDIADAEEYSWSAFLDKIIKYCS